MKLWPLFVALAAVSWGVYVPVLHEGQTQLGGSPFGRSLRAFLCVGIAYFLLAVLVPTVLLLMRSEEGSFTGWGTLFSTMAGAAGALGALGVIFALRYGGVPIYVAPLVFAGAPAVNALVSMTWHPPKTQPHLLFYAGILLAAIGAGMVLRFKPPA